MRVDRTVYAGTAALTVAAFALLVHQGVIDNPSGAAAETSLLADDPISDADAERVPLASVLALGAADSVLESRQRFGIERRPVTVAAGDTLLAMLNGAGADRDNAHAAVAALESIYDPRDLQIGQELTVIIDHDRGDGVLVGLELMPEVDRVVRVSYTQAGFEAESIARDLETRRVAASYVIEASLAADAERATVPYEVLAPLIRVYSYSVDFQRDFQPGDQVRILYERDHHPEGGIARNGAPLYAELRLGERLLAVYRFETADGVVDYFDPDGQSVRRALLRTPIDGARLSSHFGMRRHPILGYTRMHRGTDFAAPTGTPIYAAGDGVIAAIGPNRGYGNYVRVRHNRELSTAYAHMSRFAAGLSRGDRVRQGEVIGYVGSTGMSTGPHLHYEVLVDGTQVNPLSVDLPTGRTLEGTDLAAFRIWTADIDAAYATALNRADQLAETPPD